ncbi:MAG TPA: carbon storage regulator [Gemmataceae bacterium]|nr:carbon storage regulator [Gemmataceae bacterium]
MLVLSRKPGEKVVIGGGITVQVVSVRGNRVRLAIDAPDDVHIVRAELPRRPGGPTHWLEEADTDGPPALTCV